MSEPVTAELVCSVDGDDYLVAAQDLLPRGYAWPRAPESLMARFWRSLSEELARGHVRACALADESDPCRSLELLPDWERVAGLPDSCSDTTAGTLQQRRAAVCAKLAARGGQSKSYMIALAATWGFVITIDEFRPFRTGISRAAEPLSGADWWFAWRVNAPDATIWSFRAGQSTAGEPLRAWGNDVLECVLNRAKPAHTTIIFAYGGS